MARKSNKKKHRTYRESKFNPNVYDVAVLTGFAILAAVVVSTVASDFGSNTLAGQASLRASGSITCIEAVSGRIACSPASIEVVSYTDMFANCLANSCEFTCKQMSDACAQGYKSACTLQNKFC